MANEGKIHYFLLMDSTKMVVPIRADRGKSDEEKELLSDLIGKNGMRKAYKFKKKSDLDEFIRTYINNRGMYDEELPGNMEV